MSEKEPPNVIYLQWAPDGETTWCQDKINADDVRYIREDAAPETPPPSWPLSHLKS